MQFARPLTLCALLLISCAAAAANFRREAVVISMSTVACNPSGLLVALAGPPQVVPTCSEYVVVSETVEYRIRPHRHRVLLPVGEPVKFRFAKTHLLVRPDDGDQDYKFDVISMDVRTPEASNAPPQRAPSDRHGAQ